MFQPTATLVDGGWLQIRVSRGLIRIDTRGCFVIVAIGLPDSCPQQSCLGNIDEPEDNDDCLIDFDITTFVLETTALSSIRPKNTATVPCTPEEARFLLNACTALDLCLHSRHVRLSTTFGLALLPASLSHEVYADYSAIEKRFSAKIAYHHLDIDHCSFRPNVFELFAESRLSAIESVQCYKVV